MFDKAFNTWHNQKYQTYRILTVSLLALVLAVPPIVVFIGATINQRGYTISGSVSQAGAITLFVLFATLYIRRALLMARLKRSLWDEFSRVNGYQIINNPLKVVAGPIVSEGSLAQSSRFYLQGVNNGDNFTVSSTAFGFNLFSTNNQKHDMSRYSFRYIILAIDIDTELPHIFIDGMKQNRFRYNSTNMWSLSKRLKSSARLIDLEGDFYKFFKVYVSEVEQREVAALSIVAPDVMLAMRDKGYNFDYEIYDKKLYVIAEDNIISIAEFEGFISAAHSVVSELVPQLERQFHSVISTQLEINHKKAGYLSLWYTTGVYVTYALFYFTVVGLCVVIANLASIIG